MEHAHPKAILCRSRLADLPRLVAAAKALKETIAVKTEPAPQ